MDIGTSEIDRATTGLLSTTLAIVVLEAGEKMSVKRMYSIVNPVIARECLLCHV